MFARREGDTFTDRLLAWFAGIWLAALIILSIVGIVSIAAREGLVSAWYYTASTYSPFNVAAMFLHLAAASPALAALVLLNARRRRR